MIEAEAWVAVAFVLFLCLLVYVGAHRRVIGGIDARQAHIKADRANIVAHYLQAGYLNSSFRETASATDASTAICIGSPVRVRNRSKTPISLSP